MGRLPDSQPYHYHLPITKKDVDSFAHGFSRPSRFFFALEYPGMKMIALDNYAKAIREWKSKAIGNFRNMREYLQYKGIIT